MDSCAADDTPEEPWRHNGWEPLFYGIYFLSTVMYYYFMQVIKNRPSLSFHEQFLDENLKWIVFIACLERDW